MVRLIFILLFIPATLSTVSNQACRQRCRTADGDMAKVYIVGVGGQLSPVGSTSVRNYCNSMRNTIKDARQYQKDCLQDLPKVVSGRLVSGVKKQYDIHCRDLKKGTELFNKMKCINSNIETGHKCMNAYMSQLRGIANAPNERKIKLMCCKFFEMRTCMTTAMHNHCKESTKVISDFITTFAEETLDLVCSKWEHAVKECAQETVPPARSTEKHYVSLYGGLMNVLTRMVKPDAEPDCD